MFQGKTLLITGGTGSFGGAVLDRFIDSDIKEIRVFSRDEKKQYDMRAKYRSPKIKYYIGDVRDRSSVDFAMGGVDFLFHAAALKQVPSCEFYPLEAVKTNVLGTENVIDSAISNGVKKVVVLSTDKAVYPINAMGLSKALMEKVMVAKSRTLAESNETILMGTRYGNVIGSRGSVIPLFINQIKNQQALTITEPSMTRFLMSLEQAVDLVLFAFENGRQGDIFVQKAPASSIKVLCEAVQNIYHSQANIQIIGTRHGEKQYETLLTREEMFHAEDLGNYYRIPPESRDLDSKAYFEHGEKSMSQIEDYNSNNTRQLSKNEVVDILSSLNFIRESL